MSNDYYKTFAHGTLLKGDKKMMIQLEAKPDDMLGILVTDFGHTMWIGSILLSAIRNQLEDIEPSFGQLLNWLMVACREGCIEVVDGDGHEAVALSATAFLGNLKFDLRLPPHGGLEIASSQTMQTRNAELAFRLLQKVEPHPVGDEMSDSYRITLQAALKWKCQRGSTTQDDNTGSQGFKTEHATQGSSLMLLMPHTDVSLNPEGSAERASRSRGRGKKRKRGRGRGPGKKALKICGDST